MKRIIISLIVSILSIFTTLAQHAGLPTTFKGVQDNVITYSCSLNPVFEKLRNKQNVKLLIIGDSHINGNILPLQIESVLNDFFNQQKVCLKMKYIGKDGAWARRFNKEDYLSQIRTYNPDFVIIAFGTNEAHNTTVNIPSIERTYQSLVDNIRKGSHNCVFLLTTPPGSHIRYRRNKQSRRFELIPNLNTKHVADAICNFGNNNHIAVWDLFRIAGGAKFFSPNWKGNGYMRPDGVHYNKMGYEIQGSLLGHAIIDAYLQYSNNLKKKK